MHLKSKPMLYRSRSIFFSVGMHTVLTGNTILLDSKPLFGESNLVLVESGAMKKATRWFHRHFDMNCHSCSQSWCLHFNNTLTGLTWAVMVVIV